MMEKDDTGAALFSSCGEGLIPANNDEAYKFLTAGESEGLAKDLWSLFSKQCQSYTMGDSSSLPIETAEELLQSILFTIGLRLKKSGGLQQNSADLSGLFKAGQKDLLEAIETGRKLLLMAKETALDIGNISYRDTMEGLSGFFKRYNHLFLAHQIPADIDYQLCHGPAGLKGIAYINEYLRRFLIENRFLMVFKKADIISLLEAYCPDYQEQLINLFGPVYINALGLTLLGKNMLTLDITQAGREELERLFDSWREQEAKEKIAKATDLMASLCGIRDGKAKDYFRRTGEELLSRAVKLDVFDSLFLSCGRKVNQKPALKYHDNEIMDDEALRKVIDEMKTCRYTADKIAMIRRLVKSIRDLAEVLDACFFEGEYLELLRTMKDEELAMLIHYYGEKEDGPSQDDENSAVWSMRLKDYLATLDRARRDRILFLTENTDIKWQ